jgi:predicted nucleic acid-binding protein
MKIGDALKNVTQLFLDTAPVIYYVEQNPHYVSSTQPIFERIDNGSLIAVVSPVTLAECLVVPFRTGSVKLQQDFMDLLLRGQNTVFASIDGVCAERAAEMRARYNLTLLDALQVATAVSAGCEALLTNDGTLRRVTEVRILVLDELEP